ncbi:MAG: carbohydrate-binding family 9-like protein, partial [Verrucomicrobia bacterium]|nr:carbohydrate-binding family 9-like protein [Verrucomicrobiota bacterium]
FRTLNRPAPGVSWRSNLYKCGDATSHPHWLTWSPIDRPKPDFHVPDQFGTLTFA